MNVHGICMRFLQSEANLKIRPLSRLPMLEKEVEINSSPPPNKILHDGDPQADGPACEPVCAGAHTCKPICASASALDPGVYELCISPDDKGKRTAKATPEPSWADIARRVRTSNIKGISDPPLFMKFKLDKLLFVISMDIPIPKVAKESTRSMNVEI
jgi:hypothetical protein